MPDSHFTATLSGTGNWTDIESFWASLMTGAASAGLTISSAFLQNSVDNPTPVDAPSASGDGEGYDADVQLPDFTSQPGVTYRLKYSDDGCVTFSDTGYTAAPNLLIPLANGWHAGRQFIVFSDSVPGTASSPLY